MTSRPCFQYAPFNAQANTPKSIHTSIHLHGNELKWKRVRQKQDLTFEHRLEEESNGSNVVKLLS